MINNKSAAWWYKYSNDAGRIVSTIEHAWEHADDIEDAAFVHHVPRPVADGNTLTISGGHWVEATPASVLDSIYLRLDATNDPVTGALLIKPSTDVASALEVQDKDANVILSVDSVNNRVGVGTNAPTEAQHVVGNLFLGQDNDKLLLGAGKDMSTYYDGTSGYIKTSEVAASDLHLTTGAAKTMVLDTPVYKDDNASGVALGAGGSAPDLTGWDGGTIQTRVFDGGATSEQLFWGKELNHDYKEGTDLVVHIHWAPTTTNAGNVKWFVDYTIERDNTGTIAATTISAVDAADGTAWLPTRLDIGTITGTNLKIGDQIGFRLYRVPTDGDDTYGDDAAVAFTFGYHYQIDTIGSRQIGTK